jgi:hypothetical protein
VAPFGSGFELGQPAQRAQAGDGAGASAEEVVGALVAVAPINGLARVISAIPEVAMAIGYDLDQAFEALDRDSRG